MKRRIDAHHHVWDLSVRDQPWMNGDAMTPIARSFGIEEFIADADANGIAASVVVQAVADIAETEELLDLAAASPRVIGVVGWVDVSAADVADQLDRLEARSSGQWLVGIRSLVEYEPDEGWLKRPKVVGGLREVARRGLVNEFLVLPGQLPAVVDIAREISDGRFVVDHLAKPGIGGGQWDPWAHDLVEVARCDNVVAKVSGLVTEAVWSNWTAADLRPYVDHAISAFGPDRIMFGSDWPVCTLAATYAQVVDLTEDFVGRLSESDQAAIFGGNAMALYDLDTSPSWEPT